MIDVPFPPNFNTSYYNVRYTDVRFYMFGNTTLKGNDVTFYVDKLGESSFLNNTMNLITYTHNTQNYQFVYNSTNECPLSKPVPQYDSVNFSPYGIWKISLPHQSKVVNQFVPNTFVLEFKVNYAQIETPHIKPMFGFQDNNVVCVNPIGKNCGN